MRLSGAIFTVIGTLTLTFFSGANAFAQTAGAPAPAYMQFIPLAVMVAVMYFLMIRPQMKKQKDHQAFLTKLERGEEVITTGGILGRIEGLTDLYLTLEISPGVRIKVLRSAVAGSAKNAAQGAEAKA